jgi:hypothetical protein
MTFIVNPDYIGFSEQMIMNWIQKEAVVVYLRYSPGICLEGLRKIESEQCPCPDSNWAPPRCKLEALLPESVSPSLVLYNLGDVSHTR